MPIGVPMEVWYIRTNGYVYMKTNMDNKSYGLSISDGETIDLTTKGAAWVTFPIARSIKYHHGVGGNSYYEFDRAPNFAFFWSNSYGGGFENVTTPSNRISQTTVANNYVFAHVFIFMQL